MALAERRPPLSGLLRRAIDTARDEGWAAALRRAARRAWSLVHVTNEAVWYERDLTMLSAPEAARRPSSEGLSIDGDGFEELLDWLKRGDRDYMYVPEEVACARRHGHVFLSARAGGEIAGYVKIAFEAAYVGDYGRVIPLADGVAFICDTYVVPSYRGRGIAGALIASAAQTAAERGCRVLRCHIPAWNVASQRAYARAGFRPLGSVRFDRILGFPILRPRGFRL